MPIKWTDELKAELARLWYNKELRAEDIAAELGFPNDKNAIIGRAHRLGLGAKIRAKRKPKEMKLIEVQPAYDPTTKTWFIEDYLGQEAHTIRELIKKLPKNIKVMDYKPMA